MPFSIRHTRTGRPAWFARLLFAGCFLLIAFVTRAQTAPAGQEKSSGGTILGTLSTGQADSSGGLAGITVQLKANPPGDFALTADTDDSGHFEFKDLKPGSYTISVNQSGFKPFSKSLTLGAGETATVDGRLQIMTIAEQVEVTETNQTIATEDASMPSVSLSQRQLISLPTAQEKIREVLPVTPGVVKTLDGKLDFKGSDENHSLLLVNSARTTDPVTGSFAVPVPTDAVQSFNIYKTPYNAGLGNFTGGLVEVETKPPDDG